MIVLDTNQVDQLGGPQGALFVMLGRIAALGGQELALPEMVLAEHLAHYEHQVEQQVSAARVAFKALGKLDAQPWTEATLPSVAESVARRDSAMREHFTILNTPVGAAQEALVREARRKRPADVEWREGVKGTGARDVVIWLTVLDALAQPGAEVLFVSADRDFTNRSGTLYLELWQELEARGLAPDSLKMHESVASVMAAFAQKVELPSEFDPSDVSWLDVKFLVERVVRSGGLEGLRSLPASDALVVEAAVREVHTAQRGKVQAYQLGDEQWISAECRWTGVVNVGVVASDRSAQATLSAMRFSVPFTFDGTCLASRGSDGVLLRLTTLLSSTSVQFDETAIRDWRPRDYPAG